MMLFAWIGPREVVCDACERVERIPIAVAEHHCECGSVTRTAQPVWTGLAAVQAKHGNPDFPCPTCDAPLYLFTPGKPKELRCQKDETIVPVRAPTPAEKHAVLELVGIALHPKLGPTMVFDRDRLIEKWREIRASSERYRTAVDGFIPADEAAKLATADNLGDRLVAAAYPHLSNALREKLAKDEYALVRVELAENKLYLAPDILTLLAGDADDRVRHAVAVNDASPPKAIEKCAKAPEAHVRRAAAAHYALPSDLHVQLARDPDPLVREALARQSRTISAARKILETDPLDAVRSANDAGKREGERIAESFNVPSAKELGMSDEEYRQMMDLAYRH